MFTHEPFSCFHKMNPLVGFCYLEKINGCFPLALRIKLKEIPTVHFDLHGLRTTHIGFCDQGEGGGKSLVCFVALSQTREIKTWFASSPNMYKPNCSWKVSRQAVTDSLLK